MKRLATGAATLVAVAMGVVVLTPASAAADPPLDRLISNTIQSELMGYYREALNRAPDQSGYGYYVGLAAGNCWGKLGGSGVGIFTSPEFTARGLSHGQKVKALYRGLLNRDADTAGLNGYVALLNTGKAWHTIVAHMAESTEYLGRYNHICWVHYQSGNTQFVYEANGLLALPFFENDGEFLRQRELRKSAANPYDWSTDGCSGPTYDAWLLYDYRVCWRHDWGWRNYGHGLTMQRTEARRQTIDDQFRNDMYESCERRWGSGVTWQLCMVDANAAYEAVRAVGW